MNMPAWDEFYMNLDTGSVTHGPGHSQFLVLIHQCGWPPTLNQVTNDVLEVMVYVFPDQARVPYTSFLDNWHVIRSTALFS